MPPIEEAGRNDDAVLWPLRGRDAYGDALLDEPEEIKVRWDRRQEELRNKDNEIMSLSGGAVVAQEIKVGSLLWQGTLADWYGTGSAGQQDRLMEVVSYDKIPDPRGRSYLQIVGLARYKEKPT